MSSFGGSSSTLVFGSNDMVFVFQRSFDAGTVKNVFESNPETSVE